MSDNGYRKRTPGSIRRHLEDELQLMKGDMCRTSKSKDIQKVTTT